MTARRHYHRVDDRIYIDISPPNQGATAMPNTEITTRKPPPPREQIEKVVIADCRFSGWDVTTWGGDAGEMKLTFHGVCGEQVTVDKIPFTGKLGWLPDDKQHNQKFRITIEAIQ